MTAGERKLRISSISGVRILYVMATELELTPSLRLRVDPLMTGVGPVEAAADVTAALAALHERGELPDLVVALGSAGSRTLTHAQIYQAETVTYRDMDCTPLGFARGVTPFLDLPAIVPLSPMIPGIPKASLATGASIVSGAAYDRVDADMVDMETYGYVRAAMRFKTPCLSLRGISDGRAEVAGLSDWTETLAEIGEGLCAAVTLLEDALLTGQLQRGREF
jgi:adenosylhomocysteine nucleosidase